VLLLAATAPFPWQFRLPATVFPVIAFPVAALSLNSTFPPILLPPHRPMFQGLAALLSCTSRFRPMVLPQMT